MDSPMVRFNMARLVWILAASVIPARAGPTIWDGSFNLYETCEDFDKWSWSNLVGTYQWYIHGNQSTCHYLGLSPAYKNPSLTSESHGLRLTIDKSSVWNGRFERSELIPQTDANLGAGNLFYHFSIKRSCLNAPDPTLEHQITFFESHFTELKYGVGSTPTNLVWMVSRVEKWGTPFTPDIWFNFAYDIDFSAGTVGLWASTGGDPLTKVVQNIPALTYTNSKDWHLGVLRLVNSPPAEDWYFSGVYIESGPITATIGSAPFDSIEVV